MAKALTPAQIANAIADEAIAVIEKRTKGKEIDKAVVKQVLTILASRIATYFLLRRV